MIEKIFDEYAGKLLNYLTYRLGAHNDAEDVLQEVMIRIAQNLNKIKDAKNIKAYIFTIAKNESYKFLKKKIRERERISNYTQMYDYVTSTLQPDTPGTASDLAYLLSQLPENQQEVVILKVYNELTFQEIADLLETSINTVTSRYRYAIDKLKTISGDMENERTRHRTVSEKLQG